MSYNKFNRAGAYNCSICKKLTRDTGHGEAELGYCKKCLLGFEMENTEADYGVDSPEYAAAKQRYDKA